MGQARTDLIDGLAKHVGVPPLTSAEIDSLLELAGAAAHGTGDRTSAPLASFLAGVAAAGTGDRIAAPDDARRTVAELAPAAEPG
jgi:hypothetical protein